MGVLLEMTEKEPSKKTTWEEPNIAAKQDTPNPKSTNVGKTPSAEKPEQEKQLTHPSHEALKAQLLEKENRLNDYKSQLDKLEEQKIYQLAEMDNFQRRTKRDVESHRKFSLEKLIKELLPIKDSLEAALVHARVKAKPKEQDPTLSGIQLTLKQLQSLLEKNCVKSIEPIGEPFDSHFHEAMLAEESDEKPNTIIRVLQKGYLLHERLIRPAFVVVAKAKEKTS